MNRNRVVLHICDMDFPVATDNPIDEVKALGAEIDEKMREILKSNSRISVTQAAILTALEYGEQSSKSGGNVDALRAQLSEYLHDSEESKLNLELVKRENASLKREIANLKSQLKGIL
ncbi:hypothetical protein SDC9_136222 [bioreactor metagenome]|uniref:Cell division protein ZapA n=1 Tax=bioreactor metagenome TaxID=1076179 RepID=A0A645DHZ1_9ZZZZ